MNYLKIYNDICRKGQTQRSIHYTECHHILPRCMGGDNSLTNLTELSAKEHYLVHYILTKLHPTNSKILHAFGMMSRSNEFQSRQYSSLNYERMKLSHSLAMKLNNPMFDEQTRLKVSQTKKERFASGDLVPRSFSEQERANISDRMKGDGNPVRKYPEKHNFKNNKYTLGKFCYNNGLVNKYFSSDDIIPEGFVIGNKSRNKTRTRNVT